jgi:hypothetical protein
LLCKICVPPNNESLRIFYVSLLAFMVWFHRTHYLFFFFSASLPTWLVQLIISR